MKLRLSSKKKKQLHIASIHYSLTITQTSCRIDWFLLSFWSNLIDPVTIHLNYVEKSSINILLNSLLCSIEVAVSKRWQLHFWVNSPRYPSTNFMLFWANSLHVPVLVWVQFLHLWLESGATESFTLRVLLLLGEWFTDASTTSYMVCSRLVMSWT